MGRKWGEDVAAVLRLMLAPFAVSKKNIGKRVPALGYVMYVGISMECVRLET